MTLAFVFPGQGSQSVGMLAALAAAEPAVRHTFAEASAVLGYDLWDLCQTGPESELGATERTQPAMLAAGVACYRVWQARGGPQPQAMAGHSLGEYSALVCSGAIDFSVAVDLVRHRGQLMQSAVPVGQGAMAAILGLEDAQVVAACAEAAGDQVVEAVNFNAPGQVVIAGDTAAVERAIAALKARGARRAVQLPVSVPSHCALMREAAARLSERLSGVALRVPALTEVYTVGVQRHSSVDGIRRALAEQLYKPVHWSQTVRTIIERGATTMLECGPGRVLSSLNKRIERRPELLQLALDEPAAYDLALQACRERNHV